MKKLNKKTLTIVVIITLILISLVALLWILLGQKQPVISYPDEPIIQESVPASGESIDVSSLTNKDFGDHRVWGISSKINKTGVENMINKLGIDAEIVGQTEGEFYHWEDSRGNYFQYVLLKNYVAFSIVNGIQWGEQTLTPQSFTDFVSQYLSKEWEYEIIHTTRNINGSTTYHARRLTPDGYQIETSGFLGDTDYLITKDGRIIAGQIMLTEFFDPEIVVPLLDVRELNKYIDQDIYPKQIILNSGDISMALLLGDTYLDESIADLQQQVRDCSAKGYDISYFYRSFSQETLTPVYRMELECKLDYQGTIYSVPAKAYVNAIDPQYINIPE